jgi:hypothetical protein
MVAQATKTCVRLACAASHGVSPLSAGYRVVMRESRLDAAPLKDEESNTTAARHSTLPYRSSMAAPWAMGAIRALGSWCHLNLQHAARTSASMRWVVVQCTLASNDLFAQLPLHPLHMIDLFTQIQVATPCARQAFQCVRPEDASVRWLMTGCTVGLTYILQVSHAHLTVGNAERPHALPIQDDPSCLIAAALPTTRLADPLWPRLLG